MSLPLFDQPIEQARERRDLGIARAAAHADAVVEDWTDLAYRFLVRYAGTVEVFPAHHVVSAAGACSNVPPAANPKAWGAVFMRAARDGVIVKDGYDVDPNRNMSPSVRWRSLVVRSRDRAALSS